MLIDKSYIESHLTYKESLKMIESVRNIHNKSFNKLKEIRIEHKDDPNVDISFADMMYYKYTKYRDITNLLYTILVSLIKVRLMDKKNWKTTVGGIVFAIGTALMAIHDPSWMSLVGQILMASAAIFFGYHASDK